MAAVAAIMELARHAQASTAPTGITVWAAVAATLEHSRSVLLVAHLDSTTLAVPGPAMEHARTVRAGAGTPQPISVSITLAAVAL